MKRYREALKKLLNKTNEGEITWQRSDRDVPDVIGDNEQPDGPVYITKYRNRRIILTKVKYPSSAMKNQLSSSAIGELTSDMSEWQNRTKVAIENPETGGIWSFPESDLGDALLKSAKRTSSGVDDWVDDILHEE